MKTILVPTDFSPVSKNAALYALELAKAVAANKIILYNAYQAPVIAEPNMPAVQIMDFDALKSISESSLEQLRSDIVHLCDSTIELECLSEFGMLDAGINDVCESTGASIIIMGISGGSNFEEVLIGSTATSVAHNTKVPVIIVPPHAVYSPIEEIVLACDFKKVQETTPVNAIKKLLDATKAKLYVLHVNEHQKAVDNLPYQKETFEKLLEGYHPEFHFLENEDFVEAINDFSQKHSVDLIITIPKKHGLFDRLFKRSHTKHLAFHTNIPLMCIHEEGL